jgi:hypothetical protein
MEEKEQYTFEELCEGLEISMSKFAKLANVDEGTILRLRRGHLARRGTINSLLRAFSEVYGMKFTLANVSGLKKVEKPIAPVDEKAKKQPAPEKPQKRAYNRRKDTGLPEGCVLVTDFAKAHGVEPRTVYDHMLLGKGPGTIPGEIGDPMLPVKEQLDHSQRDKPGRKGETERYLTPAQQTAALDFWRRHGVPFTMPDTEQDAKQEAAWYLPD